MDATQVSPEEIQRKKDDEEVLNHPVNVDGHKLKLRDIFPDAYGARDFRVKLKLLNSKASGEPDTGPDKEKIADQLFAPSEREHNPTGMDGE